MHRGDAKCVFHLRFRPALNHSATAHEDDGR
jgi:hypothetical protein